MPAKARGTTAASAKAFVRHWVDTLNYAGPAGDTTELRGLSSDHCGACGAIIDLIDSVRADGGYIDGSGWTIESLKTVTSTRSETVIDATVLVHTQKVRTDSDADPVVFQGGRRLKTFWLSSSGGDWSLTRLDQPQ